MSFIPNYLTRICSIAKATFRYRVFSRHKAQLPLPLMVSFVHCSSIANTPTPVQFANRPLTHEHLIHQACSVSVNSASQLLTHTLVAVLDIGELYRKAMEDLLRLLDESMERTIHDLDQSELNDLLVAARSRVAELNESLLQLYSLMEYVEKYVQSTADTAFIAGAETVCISLSDRLIAAQKEMSLSKEKNKKLEEECLQVQKALVIESEERQKKNKNVDKGSFIQI